uniref:Uncharacterized protein n=1 Tax=Rhizophora mucronata TaxID=61149 RepID=A0A2P2QUP4_RHIMU
MSLMIFFNLHNCVPGKFFSHMANFVPDSP